MTFQTYMKPKAPKVVVLVDGKEVGSYEWHKYSVMPADIELAKRGGARIYSVSGVKVEVKPKGCK